VDEGTLLRHRGWRFAAALLLPTAGALLLLTVAALLMLTAVPGAARAADFTWTSTGATGPQWSAGANWVGGVAPASGATIGTLTFPALPATGCPFPPTVSPACGASQNDLTGITVGTLSFDDTFGSDTQPVNSLFGNGLTLTGGLVATPGGTASTRTFVEGSIDLPITLGAAQTWSVAGFPGVQPPFAAGRAGLVIGSPFAASPDALTVRVSNQASFGLSGDTELGPVTVIGVNPQAVGQNAIENGNVALGRGGATGPTLNATDGNPVHVSNVDLQTYGAIGPLTLSGADTYVGQSSSPAGTVTVPSLNINSSTVLHFAIVSSGSAPGTDASELSSTGPVTLSGARLAALAGSDTSGATCPAPALGTVYTLLSTTANLIGTFNVPNGGLLEPTALAPSCNGAVPFALAIAYNETGSPQTVTATVVPPVPTGVRPGVVGASPVSGRVLVRVAGRPTFTALRRGEAIPVGSEVDARHGRVRIYAATDRYGDVAAAVVSAGRFIARQTRGAHPRTIFQLSQPLTGCQASSAVAPGAATTSGASRRGPTKRRAKTSETGGNWGTRGQYVVTGVEGTTWVTEDTCTSSIVRVLSGVVAVHDLVHHRTVKLHAGQSITVRKH
jgi:hypothetical protein